MRTKLFRTSTFRLAFGYTGLFLAAALVVFTIVYFNSTNLLVRQTDETIEAEIRGLDEQYARGGIASLVETVRARSRRPGDGLYFVGDARGRHLVGNLDRLPEATPSAGGWVDFDVVRSAAANNQDRAFAKQAARARIFILADAWCCWSGATSRPARRSRR